MPDKNKKAAIKQLALIDYCTAMVSWSLFWAYRYRWLGKSADFTDAWRHMDVHDILTATLWVPVGWMFLYLLSGTYFDLYRKSRLNEINRTLISCVIGCLSIAMFVFSNDANDYSYFIKMTGRYLFIHTSLTLVFRIVMLNIAKHRLVRGKVGFSTLL